MIVHSLDPITLIGGAYLDRHDLNKSLTIAPIIVAADGGARHLTANDPEPAAIIGDFDSLTEEARERFKGKLHHVAEQDSTDFEKVIQRVQAPLYLALGFLGGRIDHSFSAFNLLARHADRQIILIGEQDVVTRVNGSIHLTLPVGTPIALLPMGPSRAFSEGLEWELTGQPLAPDGMISSCNRVARTSVHIRTEGPVLLTLPKVLIDPLIAAVHAG